MTLKDVERLREGIEELAAGNQDDLELVTFLSQVHKALEYAWYYLNLGWLQSGKTPPTN